MPGRAKKRTVTTIGVDIGQQRDPTAIAVAEIEYRDSDLPGCKQESHYLIRHLERLPLGTVYPEVSKRIDRICQGVEKRTGRRADLFVDATGVGKPIVDLLNDSSRSADRVWAVYFTHGDRRNEVRRDHRVSLGKAYLVSRLQVLLQYQRLHLPRGHREADALVRELLDYEIRVDDNAHEKFGAFRVGTHDDLVTALGLAVQTEPTSSVDPGNVRYGL